MSDFAKDINVPTNDCISRQAAIDALVNKLDSIDHVPQWVFDELTGVISELPSAQPEIIRCKDCKWYGRADKRRFYRGTDCLNHRIDTIVPDKDYCSRAERRTDDANANT